MLSVIAFICNKRVEILPYGQTLDCESCTTVLKSTANKWQCLRSNPISSHIIKDRISNSVFLNIHDTQKILASISFISLLTLQTNLWERWLNKREKAVRSIKFIEMQGVKNAILSPLFEAVEDVSPWTVSKCTQINEKSLANYNHTVKNTLSLHSLLYGYHWIIFFNKFCNLAEAEVKQEI